MKIILIRHGQTNYNSKRLIQGHVDAPLNNVGLKQAREAGNALKKLEITIDKVISSPLSRALETGHVVAKKIGYKEHIIIDYNFIERDFGKFELTKIADNFPKIIDNDHQSDGVENNDALLKRIKEGIINLNGKYKNKTVLIAAHAHVIRSFYILFDKNKYNYMNFFLGNGSIHIFQYLNDELKLLETHNNEEQ
ncbi:MAG TPA: histidine phosphatase family protein [Acholeplasmataceae bacterium]|nr:histidine phosphatase family protein [Acholeplasmataceae bacterium]